jgi:hypothetical protein
VAADAHGSFADDADNPARRAFVVEPHDDDELAILPKALLIGGAGQITLRAVDSPDDVTFPVASGQVVPIRASHVRASGTTATAIIGLA